MRYAHMYKIWLPAVALLVLASCSEDLNKSDYDYFTGNESGLPAITLAVSNPSGTTVDFVGTLTSTAHTDTTILEQGIMCSTDSLFKEGVVFKSVDDSFSGMVQGLSGNTNYFAKAYVMTKSGVAYSSVVKFRTRLVQLVADFSLDSLMNHYSEYGSIDKDGDGNDWIWTYYDEEQTQLVGYSFSWDKKPLTPENYLLFPVVDIPAGFAYASVSVALEAADSNYPSEVFKLVVSENPITADNCQDAAVLLVETLTAGEHVYTANLPESYVGKKAYIALCHYDCSDNYALTFKGHTVTVTK